MERNRSERGSEQPGSSSESDNEGRSEQKLTNKNLLKRAMGSSESEDDTQKSERVDEPNTSEMRQADEFQRNLIWRTPVQRMTR